MNSKGLTFLEIVISLFILTIAMLGYSQIHRTALESGHRAIREIIATNLTRGLIAEIMSKDFEEPGSPGSFAREEADNRYLFDDVDDFHNWSELPPITIGIPPTGGQPMDGTVAGVPDYSDFTREVKVKNIDCDDGSDAADGSTDCKEVRVTVSGPYVRDIDLVEVKTP